MVLLDLVLSGVILIVVQRIQFPCKNYHIPAIAVPKLNIVAAKRFRFGERNIFDGKITNRP